MISDMSKLLDPSQYANQKGISLQHYLIQMIHQILKYTDNNAKGEVNAVIATLYDWKEAVPRQCPELGEEVFIKCGVRNSLIPLFIKYLQDRTMQVKWHGQTSSIRKLNGGGPQGATFGIWEYLAKSYDNATCVDPNYRFKFVDDLTVLELSQMEEAISIAESSIAASTRKIYKMWWNKFVLFATEACSHYSLGQSTAVVTLCQLR